MNDIPDDVGGAESAEYVQLASQPLQLFQSELVALLDFHLFVDQLTSDADRMASLLARTAGVMLSERHSGSPHSKVATRKLDRIASHGYHARRLFATYEQMHLEMILCRSVDTFLSYISGLLGVILRHRPEMLRSADKITVEFAISHASIDELIDSLAERKVHELSFLGVEKLSRDLERRIGLPLFTSDEITSRVILIVETRNLLVHNHGIVNEIFNQRTGRHDMPLGSRVHHRNRPVSNGP